MRILHMLWGLGMGGAENIVTDIANIQARTERVSIVIVNTAVDPSILARIGSQVTVFQVNRPPNSINPYYFAKLNWYIAGFRPDIIHCHALSAIRVLALQKARKVLTVHGTNHALKNYIAGYDRVFAISHAVSKAIVDQISSVSPITVYNGVDFESIQSKSGHPQAADQPFRVVQVGSLNHNVKGQDVAIEALSILKLNGSVRPVELDFIGEGKSRAYLESLALQMRVEHEVRLLGNWTRDRLNAQLKEYDLLLQPSRHEGFGLTIAEGMAARLPVLVSDIAGPMEVIAEGSHGYHFTSGSAKACADMISRIVNEAEGVSFPQSIEKNWLYARERFDIKGTAANYVQEYARLVGIS